MKLNYLPKGKTYWALRTVTSLGVEAGMIFERREIDGKYVPKDTFGAKRIISHTPAYTKGQIDLLIWAGVVEKIK